MKNQITVTQYSEPLTGVERNECLELYSVITRKALQLKSAAILFTKISEMKIGIIADFDISILLANINAQLFPIVDEWKSIYLGSDFYENKNNPLVHINTPIENIEDYYVKAIAGITPYIFQYEFSPKLQDFLDGEDTSLKLRKEYYSGVNNKELIDAVNKFLIS